MADSVRVDTEAVRAAGHQAAAGGDCATPGCDQVRPNAGDMVSVGTSTRFSAQMTAARTYTAMANAQARQFGMALNASAAAYDDQDAQSAQRLGHGAPGAITAAAGYSAAGEQVMPAGLGSGAVNSDMPAGEVPASPRDIARLIEAGRGGAGTQAWQAVETSLRCEARQLTDASDQLGQAITTTEQGWQAASANAATAQMRALQTWYQGHARYVQGLADQAKTHVRNFSKALTDVPSYRRVVDAERELKAAIASNARSGGAYRVAVVHAQVKVNKLYQASSTGFSSYTFAEATPEPKMPIAPPKVLGPSVAHAVSPGGGSDGPVGPLQPQHSPTGAPAEPVQEGPGLGQEIAGGPAWPPGAVDPNVAGDPLTDAVVQTLGVVPSAVIPGIIGGVFGGVGGVLGGLAGAGQKALQGMGQAAGPLTSGLGQHPQGGQPQQGGEQPSQSAEPSAGDVSAPDDVGVAGGDTMPAGGVGAPLVAPTEVAAAPAVAAPVSASSPAPAEAPAPAVGAMGPMMPPVRGTGNGSGPDNKRLYENRTLKVVAPANSEPVKNRRETRTKSTDRTTP